MLLKPYLLSRRLGWTTGLVLALSAAGATAGTLDPLVPPSDPTSAMFTLTDLYNRLNAGTTGLPRPGAFVEPVAGPAVTGYTLNEIMAKMPAVDATNGAAVADVLANKTFWGLISGAWGLKTGTATVGADGSLGVPGIHKTLIYIGI